MDGENIATAGTSIELAKLGQDSKNQFEEKLDIMPDDDGDEHDTLQDFQPVAFYFLKRDKIPRLLFVKLVSWSYPLMVFSCRRLFIVYYA